MNENYTIKFRRNNKEKFWVVKKGVSLYYFRDLLESMFEKTDEESLEILIFKTKSPEQKPKKADKQ